MGEGKFYFEFELLLFIFLSRAKNFGEAIFWEKSKTTFVDLVGNNLSVNYVSAYKD